MNGKTKSRILICIFGLLCAASAAFVTYKIVPSKLRIDDRDSPVLLPPRWMLKDRQCKERGPDERIRDELALQTLKSFSPVSVMGRAAVEYFGIENYAYTDNDRINFNIRLCPPKELYPQIAAIAVSRGVYSFIPLGQATLNFTDQIDVPDPVIVDAVGRSAFSPTPAHEGARPRDHDLRVDARITLSGFGKAAAPWAEQAFREINADDKLGTSAAYVAIAAGYPQAMQKVSDLLENLLQTYPSDPIPYRVALRFNELARALMVVGPEARPYAKPIVKMLSRKVQSWASPFGMLTMGDTDMCPVMNIIGGPDSEIAQASSTCIENEKLLQKAAEKGER